MVVPATTRATMDFLETPYLPTLPDTLPPKRAFKLQFRKSMTGTAFNDGGREDVDARAEESLLETGNVWEESVQFQAADPSRVAGHPCVGSHSINRKWRLLQKQVQVDAPGYPHTPPELSSLCCPRLYLPLIED